MSAASPPSRPAETPGTELPVPLPRLAGFVRQVTHDVRNTLNSLDLQAAYVLELITDPEALEEVRRMRALIHSSARDLHALSGNFWTPAPNFVEYGARILVEDFQARLVKLHPKDAPRTAWEVDLDDESVSIDIELFFGALMRLFENAWIFSDAGTTIRAHVFTEQDHLVFEIRQSSPPPAGDLRRWGREPFVTTRRGAYGLGLYRARMSLAAHESELEFSHDSGRNLLLTRVTLRLAPLHESDRPAPDSRH